MKQDKRRQFIKEVLARRRPLLDLDETIELLKDEPEARVRRLRSSAIINLDDVAVYSALLKQEFPYLVYFFANYKTRTPRPPKFADDVSIVFHESLEEAVKEALKREKEDGLNRPDIFVRWPWPEELASADPEQLIGGREFPDEVFRLAIQYRDVGRWFTFHYSGRGYLDPRLSEGDMRLDLSRRSKMPLSAYPDFKVLNSTSSEFFALYDLNDAETMAFAKRAHALWRRVSTTNVALYDPITRDIAVLNEKDWAHAVPMTPGTNSRALGVKPKLTPDMQVPDPKKWTHLGSVGKQALAGALQTPPRYAAFAFTPLDGKSAGPALVIGPRPAIRKQHL